MLGLGGGVFWCTFLNVALGFPSNVASGVGLIPSSPLRASSPADTGRSGIVNRGSDGVSSCRRGGAATSAAAARQVPEHLLQLTFPRSAVIAGINAVAPRTRRNIPRHRDRAAGPFGGRFYDGECGREVVYRTRRIPDPFGVSLIAGSISGLLGIGGGILQVPALNACAAFPCARRPPPARS